MNKGSLASGTQINLELHTSEPPVALVLHSGFAEANAWLKKDKWPDGRIWLVGSQSAGKSCLVNEWAKEFSGLVIGLKQLDEIIKGGNLEQLLDQKFCAIEDIPQKPSDIDEENLFHLLSTAQVVDCKLILTSRFNPSEIEWTLPDIRSRAVATCVAPIEVESKQERLPLLLSALSRYQLKFSPSLVEWLSNNLAMHSGIVFSAAEKLYKYSLQSDLPRNQRALQALIVDNYPELFD